MFSKIYKYKICMITFILLHGCAQIPTNESILKLKNEPCYLVSECISVIKTLIRYNLKTNEVGQDYNAILAIWLDSNNQIKDVKIVESNGGEKMDKHAKIAVRASAPFTMLEGLNGNQRELFDEIVFILNPKKILANKQFD